MVPILVRALLNELRSKENWRNYFHGKPGHDHCVLEREGVESCWVVLPKNQNPAWLGGRRMRAPSCCTPGNCSSILQHQRPSGSGDLQTALTAREELRFLEKNPEDRTDLNLATQIVAARVPCLLTPHPCGSFRGGKEGGKEGISSHKRSLMGRGCPRRCPRNVALWAG